MIPFTSSELGAVLAGGDERVVRAGALEIDYRAIAPREGALAVAAVLLFPAPEGQTVPPESVARGTPFGQWIARLRRQGNRRAFTLVQWCTSARTDVALYPIFLFNRNFGDTRRIFQTLLAAEKQPPPYHWLVLLNILHARLGLSHTDLHRLASGPFERFAPYLDALFSDRKIVEQWLTSKPQPLRFYGGATNTVLGLYDDIFSDPRTGAKRLRKRAELCFDIGGGFATAEVARLVGVPFTSADIVTPSMEQYDPELVIHVAKGHERVPADDKARSAHFARQRHVPHLPFDVLEMSLPAHAKSYTIVSAGFMTSTVRPRKRVEGWKGTRFGHVGLSVHAILRVVELAALGKEVDLFTVQRATSRFYKYKTCLLRWRGGKLVTLVTTDDSTESWLSPSAAAFIRAAIGQP